MDQRKLAYNKLLFELRRSPGQLSNSEINGIAARVKSEIWEDLSFSEAMSAEDEINSGLEQAIADVQIFKKLEMSGKERRRGKGSDLDAAQEELKRKIEQKKADAREESRKLVLGLKRSIPVGSGEDTMENFVVETLRESFSMPMVARGVPTDETLSDHAWMNITQNAKRRGVTDAAMELMRQNKAEIIAYMLPKYQGMREGWIRQGKYGAPARINENEPDVVAPPVADGLSSFFYISYDTKWQIRLKRR